MNTSAFMRINLAKRVENTLNECFGLSPFETLLIQLIVDGFTQPRTSTKVASLISIALRTYLSSSFFSRAISKMSAAGLQIGTLSLDTY